VQGHGDSGGSTGGGVRLSRDVIVAGGEGMVKSDRGRNYISRRYGWIPYVTKVPAWSVM
jgi:hypothetical protein